MTLLDFINSLSVDDQRKFASQCETTIGYIRKAISNDQLFGPRLCVLFEKNSCNKVTRKDLRPNDWHEIWPELINETHKSVVNE